MRLDMIGTYIIIGITGLTVSASAADSPFVRELDAYCVSADGVRRGVAASQDGATNSYVQHPSQEPLITRSVHSRRTVSRWHTALNAAGFDTLAGTEAEAPYCAIERIQYGQSHDVQWRDGETPAALVDVFGSMLGMDTSSLEVQP